MTLRDETDAAVGSLSVLADDVRRDLYFHVREAATPISRDQAAELVGISRNLAAFHLEKLVVAGLLTVSLPRLPRLRRPGRVPKLYAVADEQIELSLPPRRYRTIASVFIESVQQGGDAARATALDAAASCGRQIGAATLEGARVGRLGVERALGLVRPVLEDNGYEPEVHRTDGTQILLRNCPFHALLEADQGLVCALNCELVGGMLSGLGAEVLEARLIPRPEHCCVTVVPRARTEEPQAAG
ncbi:MAG TPA: transcriptional regulator [Sporichthyaceae bacterium]|nr:transcriptional regulator [Sporichthyaceae bacterium]